jgi:lipoprotein-anchoring transpeptidase ErfK/SrfK
MQSRIEKSASPANDSSSTRQRGGTRVEISIRDQQLTLTRDGKVVRSYPVSTSRFGIGTEEGSLKTPLGNFRIAEKIGHGAAPGTIFKARVALGPDDPLPDTEDFVTSRILWLDGLDPENANTRDRFIYIHGTKHENRMGVPDSHGCIRMRNADVIELFDMVDETTQVVIRE